MRNPVTLKAVLVFQNSNTGSLPTSIFEVFKTPHSLYSSIFDDPGNAEVNAFQIDNREDLASTVDFLERQGFFSAHRIYSVHTRSVLLRGLSFLHLANLCNRQFSASSVLDLVDLLNGPAVLSKEDRYAFDPYEIYDLVAPSPKQLEPVRNYNLPTVLNYLTALV